MPGMGDRQMASVLAKRQERVDEITMSYNDHLDSLTEDLFAKGVVNAEGKLHFAAAFAEGMRGSIIPTVYEKAAKFVSGQDPQEGFDSVKRLVEQGVIEPRAGAEMLGAMAAITLDVAATRGLAFSLLPLSAARTAGAAKFGRRVVGAAEGALEGLPADIMRAVTREDEGAGTTAFGTAIGALAGAVLPGPKNVSDEMFERIRTAFRSDNPSEAIASLLREVRPGGFEDTIKRLAPGAPQGQLPPPARVGEPPVGERFAREEAERLRAERGGGGTPGEIKEAVTERIDEVFPSEPAPQPRLPTPEEVGARFEEITREKPIITPAPKQRKLLARPKSDADFEFGDPEALAPKPNVMAGPALLYETPSGVRLYSSTVAERMNHRHVIEDMFADGIDVNDPGIIDDLSFGFVDHDGKFYFDSDAADVFDTASSEGMLRKGFMGPKAPEPVGGDVAIDVTERNLARQRAEDAARAAEPLELEHYGARVEDVDFLDPEQMGTGLKGEERKRLAAYPEHAVPRTYFYPAGKRAEPGLRGKPSVRVNVDRSTIATFEQLQEAAAAVRAEFPDAASAEIVTRAEKRLFEAGWEGYVGSNGNVAKFTPTRLKPDLKVESGGGTIRSADDPDMPLDEYNRIAVKQTKENLEAYRRQKRMREGRDTQLQPEGTAAARSLLNKVKNKGGFSVDPRTGEDITGGFSVGGSKSFERRVAKTPEEIVQYQAEHADELAREGNFLGGWEQGDAGRTTKMLSGTSTKARTSG
jgi:hypothetical protein